MKLNDGLSLATFGSGPPLVSLPGLNGGADLSVEVPKSASWSSQALARGTGRTVHLIHRPLTVSPGMTIATLAGWHATALRSRFAGPVDVLGTSAGGVTALQLAMDHPDVVRRLVVAIAAARVSEHGRSALLRQVRMEREGRSAAWSSSGLVGRGPLRLAAYVAFRRGGPRAQGEAAVVDSVQTWDVMDRLGEISAPTLVVGGTRDPLVTEEALRATAAGIPHGHLVVVPHRGHLTTMLSTRVTADIRGFLNATTPDTGGPARWSGEKGWLR